MSGGVDSSVAAALLKDRGYDVIGAHIKCFNIDGCGERDAEDARRVAEQLKIPFYVFDLEKEYKERVVRYMIDGYRKGITPNPDIMCNKEIKFGLFFQRALQLGTDFVATGHYVKLKELTPQRVVFSRIGVAPTPVPGPFGAGIPASEAGLGTVGARLLLGRKTEHSGVRAEYSDQSFSASESFSQTLPAAESNSGVNINAIFGLFEAKDKNKDQSYFLWTLTQEQLKHCVFPIGDYKKNAVRKLAKKFDLLTADKKDSQGICFIGKVTLADFLKDYISPKKGVVLNAAGEKIGTHQGAQFYTIGQRHGFNLNNSKITDYGLRIKKNISPHYVVSKNIKENVLVVAEGSDNNALYKKEMELVNINFINPNYSQILKNLRISVLVRVRYRQPLFSATLTHADFTQTNAEKNGVRVIFDEPQKFVASGQSAVFYDQSGQMLGGGVIL